jgi:hypothetical protein
MSGVDAAGADLPRPPQWGPDGVEDVFAFDPGYAPEWTSEHVTVTRDELLDSAGRMVPLKVWDGVDWVAVASDWVP